MTVTDIWVWFTARWLCKAKEEKNWKMPAFQMGTMFLVMPGAAHVGTGAISEQNKADVLTSFAASRSGSCCLIPGYHKSCIYWNLHGFGWLPCVTWDQTRILRGFNGKPGIASTVGQLHWSYSKQVLDRAFWPSTSELGLQQLTLNQFIFFKAFLIVLGQVFI